MEDHDVSVPESKVKPIRCSWLTWKYHRYSEILDYHNVEAASVAQMENHQFLGQQ